MISISQSNKYDVKMDNVNGVIYVSKNIDSTKKYKYPFNKMPKVMLKKIGNGKFNSFDDFIITSLNDCYNKLNSPGDINFQEKLLEDYKRLYSLWTKICESKDTNNIYDLKKLYDKISYGLYLLGYEDNML